MVPAIPDRQAVKMAGQLAPIAGPEKWRARQDSNLRPLVDKSRYVVCVVMRDQKKTVATVVAQAKATATLTRSRVTGRRILLANQHRAVVAVGPDPFPDVPFFEEYQQNIERTKREAPEVLAEAQNCLAPWMILAHYLFEEANKRVHEGRVQPLLEVMQGSPTSIYVAATGAYREAISLIRPLVEMTLHEWYFTAIAQFDEKESMDYSYLSFSGKPTVPPMGLKKLKSLFSTPEVRAYARFVSENAKDEEEHDQLLWYVDPHKVHDEWLNILSAHIHGHIAGMNVVQVDITPFPSFDREQLTWWKDLFRQAHEAIALWMQFIYPDLMAWSRLHPTEPEAPQSSSQYWMEAYWSDLLRPLQRQFFSLKSMM